MKVIAYTALHYGHDYLEWAIRSVIDHVDEYHVLYSPIGSHGHRTDRKCPDDRWTLISDATRGAGDKLRWHDGTWNYEGQQREAIHQYAPDAEVILVLDADEVWSEGLAAKCISAAKGYSLTRRFRVPIIHYWRSFYRCVLSDPAFPERIICPKNPNGEETLGLDGFINHLGYAQRSEIVEYKQHTHGHKGEWRRDVDWFQDRFMANAQVDCHPVGSQYWNPEPVNPADYMPEFMKDHPYFNMEIIP